LSAIYHREFLMERLDWVVSNAMGTVIQNAGNAHLGKLLLCCLGITVGKMLGTGPDQNLDLNPLTHCVLQHSLDRQIVRAPEVNLRLLEAFGAKLRHQGFLFWAAIWSCTLI
jgi:hypothetical protein